MKKFLYISLASIICLSLSYTASAFSSGFTIYPNSTDSKWIEKTLAPGSTTTQDIILANTTSQKIDLSLEFNQTTGSRENIKISEKNSESSLAKWITYPKKVTLNPNEKRHIETVISIPENTPTQEFQGVLLASYSNKNSDLLTVNTRIGTRYYIKVATSNTIQTNIFQIPGNSLQTILIIISSIGIIYGIKKPKTVKVNS